MGAVHLYLSFIYMCTDHGRLQVSRMPSRDDTYCCRLRYWQQYTMDWFERLAIGMMCDISPRLNDTIQTRFTSDFLGKSIFLVLRLGHSGWNMSLPITSIAINKNYVFHSIALGHYKCKESKYLITFYNTFTIPYTGQRSIKKCISIVSVHAFDRVAMRPM